MGAFFGIGAFYDLAFEGARLGSVFAACYKLNPPFGNALASFVVGHGVIELSCIFFCGGAGMMIGYAMINPGDLTRAQALKKKGMEAARHRDRLRVFSGYRGHYRGISLAVGFAENCEDRHRRADRNSDVFLSVSRRAG